MALHGGRPQDQREAAIETFKKGDVDILVCTNVAGRGIDIRGITHVVNYDMPKDIQTYTHRIGRTGRGGDKGESTSFLTPEDEDIYYDLKKMLQMSDCSVPHELARHPAAQQKPGTVGYKPRTNIVFKAWKKKK